MNECIAILYLIQEAMEIAEELEKVSNLLNETSYEIVSISDEDAKEGGAKNDN